MAGVEALAEKLARALGPTGQGEIVRPTHSGNLPVASTSQIRWASTSGDWGSKYVQKSRPTSRWIGMSLTITCKTVLQRLHDRQSKSFGMRREDQALGVLVAVFEFRIGEIVEHEQRAIVLRMPHNPADQFLA